MLMLNEIIAAKFFKQDMNMYCKNGRPCEYKRKQSLPVPEPGE